MHLEEIAFHIAPGAHAVVLLDQAGWHGSTELVVPSNITLMPLPPRCPELNPVENVWQFMRDNWLSNRIYQSYDDIVDHCCFAWNKLVDQPWRIMSIGLRGWAHGSSSMCVGITHFASCKGILDRKLWRHFIVSNNQDVGVDAFCREGGTALAVYVEHAA